MTMTTSNLLRVRGESLELVKSKGSLLWSLPIMSVLLIAEYTTNEGPNLDDYFLVFATAEVRQLYFSTCSFYSTGREDALNLLEQFLGSPIQLGLANSTEWRSRIVWPADMAGSEYFTFKPAAAQTFGKMLKHRLFGPTYQYAVSGAVQEYLRRQLNARFIRRPPVADAVGWNGR